MKTLPKVGEIWRWSGEGYEWDETHYLVLKVTDARHFNGEADWVTCRCILLENGTVDRFNWNDNNMDRWRRVA